MQHVPTEADVARIAGLADPVLRNLLITQAYHELSRALTQRLGASANWCTFATWASKQAGQTIRGEDLRQAFEDRLAQSEDARFALDALAGALERFGRRPDVQALRDAVLRTLDPGAAFARAADAVARGNRKVFEEIGHAFARYLAFFDDDADFDPARTARFCDGLRPGDPPEGQRLLHEAFRAYREASFASDAQRRSEWLFLANLLVGLHEQTRLQPEIAEALNASVGERETVRQRILERIMPGFWMRARVRIARLIGRPLPLDVALDRLFDVFQREVRRTLTRRLMTLRLPEGRVLALGQDLREAFAPMLAQPTLPALRDVLARVDATPESLRDSGARDWADFPDRMHFIADLFRTHHAWPPLLGAPFTEAQVEALRQNRRPSGDL